MKQNSTFCVTRCIQNVILLTHGQDRNTSNKMLPVPFYEFLCVLHFESVSGQTGPVSKAQCGQGLRVGPCGSGGRQGAGESKGSPPRLAHSPGQSRVQRAARRLAAWHWGGPAPSLRDTLLPGAPPPLCGVASLTHTWVGKEHQPVETEKDRLRLWDSMAAYILTSSLKNSITEDVKNPERKIEICCLCPHDSE